MMRGERDVCTLYMCASSSPLLPSSLPSSFFLSFFLLPSFLLPSFTTTITPSPQPPQVFNVGQKVVTRNTTGYIPSQIAFYLQNIHIEPRKIWLTRHAESLDQVMSFR